MRKNVDVIYPKNITSLGDHLLAARLDRSMKQKAVAKLLGVCPETLFGWERNKREPDVQYDPGIMNFLAYCPVLYDQQSNLAIELGTLECTEDSL